MAGNYTKREKNPNEVGGAWCRKAKSGKEYLFVKIKLDDKNYDPSNIALSMFRNSAKREGTNLPDYVVLISTITNREESSQPSEKPAVEKQSAAAAAPASDDSQPF